MATPTTHPAFASNVEEREFLRRLVKTLQQINHGLQVEEILEDIFESFVELLPYDRIGFSLVENKTYEAVAKWARCRYSEVYLKKGYAAPLKGSSLEKVLLTGEPRIIGDLKQYAHDHPESESTRLVLDEGIRSSLTCPITRADTPIGFLFFSSTKPNAYRKEHIEAFRTLAQPLALALDKAQLYERLIQLNEEKNLFLGMAAHDLRNPIAQIQTTAELLRANGLSPSEHDELVGLIVSRCQSMTTLLHDILDVSAIEAGQIPLRLEPVRMGPFCQAILGALAPLAKAKQIEFVLENKMQSELSVDPARLSQVLENLLINSIKFSPEKTSIKVRIVEQPTHCELSVIDQGAGIPKGDLPNLFKPFRSGGRNSPHGEMVFGVGLGLVIVKKIVEAHGGEITVVSDVGKGVAFTIRLPLTPAHP